MTGDNTLHSLLSRQRVFELALLVLVLQIGSGYFAPHASAAQQAPLPIIRDVNIETPQVARYEKFQATFFVDTRAARLNLPYDAQPPQGIEPGAGITVDALFSNDNWKTTIVQPAFLYQPVQTGQIGKRNYLLPDGQAVWMVRFAPQATGTWQFRLRAQDRDGTTVFPKDDAFEFQVRPATGRYDGLRVHPSSARGFLRVSANDPRYFEFQNGTPFIGLGYNPGINLFDEVDARFRDWQLNGLDFARVWLSRAGINGSQWPAWTLPKQSLSFSTMEVWLDEKETFGDATFSFRLDEKHPCMFADFWQGGISVKPNTTYSVTVRAKLANVQAKPNATNAGLTVMQIGWAKNGCQDLTGTPLVPPRAGTTDWYTATGTLTTGANQFMLDYLFMALVNTTQGTAYIDEITLVARDDPYGTNLLRRPRADSHLYFDSINAAEWDHIIESAAARGIYLKIVVDEKNEWIRNVLNADGTVGKFNNNNFYAAPDTAVRWVQQAWWRYLIARWGYSTAIHSFEYINEGDPYNGKHYNAANAMAEYFDAHDPSQHMVTTSMWHSFPGPEFWNNPKYSALDYADLHAYITTGWGNNASFVPPANLETRAQNVHSGNGAFRIPAKQNVNVQINPRGLTLNEPGEWILRYWMKAENFQADCPRGSDGAMQRVQWLIDGGNAKGKPEGVVPGNVNSKAIVCNSPDGTFDWEQFSSERDRDGNPMPREQRIIITDTLPHELSLYVRNNRGITGTAWIDDVELVSPSGQVMPVIGEFEPNAFSQDTAWYTAAYSLLWGGSSPVGAHKPLVRGESGLNSKDNPNGLPNLNQDQQGVWLHNFVWGQINAGGMYDLLWWGEKYIEANPKAGRRGALYNQFQSFARFMRDVPLNNGHYRDAKAVTSDPRLRAWGQRDDVNRRAHLWIQNTQHQWDRVLANAPIEPIDGTITLEKMQPGECRVEWWDTSPENAQVILRETTNVTDTLVLKLPMPLRTDIAVHVKCERA